MNKKLLLFGCMILTFLVGTSQTITDTVTIGMGTADNYFYGPIYRSSSTSSFDFCRYSYLYTPAEMAAAGIPVGATIKGIAWDKVTADSTNGAASLEIYMESNSLTTLGSTPWTGVIASATQVYANAAQSIPPTTGWLFFDLGANTFTYAGGSFQISTNWDISAVASPPTTGAFRWSYETVTDQAIGIASSSLTGIATLGSSSYSNRRPNIQIIYEFTPLADDMVLAGLTSPGSGCLSSAEVISIDISNLGINAASNFQLGYQLTDPVSGQAFPVVETFAGTLASGASTTYTFTTPADFSNPGTYALSTFVSYGPDLDNSNNGRVDSITNEKRLAPWFEDFESFGEGITNNYPNGWSDGGGNFTWESEAGTTTSSNTGPTIDNTLGTATGIYMYTEASSRTGTFNLVSPCVDLSALSCPRLKFFYHMYGSSIVSLSVDVSTDGGATYDEDVAILVGQQQTSGVAPWDSLEVSLIPYDGQTILVRFRGQTVSFESDIAIDDIEIFDGTGNDVAITAITAPMTGCGLGQEPVTVQLSNQGCDTLRMIPIGFQVGLTGTPVVEVVPGPIAAGESISYTFSGTANLGTTGTFQLGVATGLVGDINPGNDTLTIEIENLNATLPNAPTTQGDLICLGDSATLVASGSGVGDTVIWYTDPVGGSAIGVGDTLITPPIFGVDTFYAAIGSFIPQQLTPTFANNNGASGNMFDIEATGGPVIIDSLTINTSSTTTVDVEVWYKPGSYAGNTSNSSAWISLGRDTLPANGSGVATPIPTHLNVAIPAGETYAFNVFVYSGGINYTTGTTQGAVFASDNFITFFEGIGTNSAFPTTFNSPRVWNGDIFYTAAGCESDRTVAVAEPHPTLQPINFGPDTTICGNDTLTLDAGNTGFNVTYTWNTSATTQSITATGVIGGVDTSVYVVTVSDTLGCSTTEDLVVIALQPLETSTTITDVDCFGNLTGAVDLSPLGGTGIYAYTWSNGDTTEDLTGLAGGTYNVVVTDDFGCTTSTSAAVMAPSAPLGAAVDSLVDVLCQGESTGEINVTISGGTMPYTFAWSNGDASEDPMNLPAGMYSGVVTDDNGCVLNTPSLTIAEPATAVSINVDGVGDEGCKGDQDGFIFITPMGGTPPYTYLWSNGSTDPDLNGISAGSYSGTVTDANGCDLTAGPVVIMAQDSLPTAGFTNVNSGAVVTFTNTSSANAVSYSWDFGDSTALEAGANPTHVYAANGMYEVTLIAFNNCGSDTLVMTIDMTSVSLDGLLNANIRVYPNPTDGQFNVAFSDLLLDEVSLRISSLEGKMIYAETLGTISGTQTHEVVLPDNLPEGMYILNIQTANGALIKRLIVK